MITHLVFSLLFSLIIGTQAISQNRQMISIYMELPSQTFNKIKDLKIKNPYFVEVASGQKQILLNLLKEDKIDLSSNQIFESNFEFRVINIAVRSRFLRDLNNWREGEGCIFFEGKYFLSSYITMIWLEYSHDYQRSLVIMKDQFFNQVEKQNIQLTIDELILRKEWRQQPKEAIPNYTKQTETLIEKYKSTFIEKENENHFMRLFGSIRQFFFIINETQMQNLIKSVKNLSLKDQQNLFIRDSQIQKYFSTLLPFLLNPNDINFQLEKNPSRTMLSIYIYDIQEAIKFATKGYQRDSFIFIEVPSEQFQLITSAISKNLQIETSVVYSKIIKSPLTLNEIHLLQESGYLKGIIENIFIFKHSKYLFSQYLLRKNCVSDQTSKVESLKYIFSRLFPNVNQQQYFKIVQPLVLHEDVMNFQEIFESTFNSNNQKNEQNASFISKSRHICNGGDKIHDFIKNYGPKLCGQIWYSSNEPTIKKIGKEIENYLKSVYLVLSRTELIRAIKKLNCHIEKTIHYYEKEEPNATVKYASEYYISYFKNQIKTEINKRSPLSFQAKNKK